MEEERLRSCLSQARSLSGPIQEFEKEMDKTRSFLCSYSGAVCYTRDHWKERVIEASYASGKLELG